MQCHLGISTQLPCELPDLQGEGGSLRTAEESCSPFNYLQHRTKMCEFNLVCQPGMFTRSSLAYSYPRLFGGVNMPHGKLQYGARHSLRQGPAKLGRDMMSILLTMIPVSVVSKFSTLGPARQLTGASELPSLRG